MAGNKWVAEKLIGLQENQAEPQSLGEREQLSSQGWGGLRGGVTGPVGVHGPEYMVSTSGGKETTTPPPPPPPPQQG